VARWETLNLEGPILFSIIALDRQYFDSYFQPSYLEYFIVFNFYLILDITDILSCRSVMSPGRHPSEEYVSMSHRAGPFIFASTTMRF
jgi:hypothetical protein